MTKPRRYLSKPRLRMIHGSWECSDGLTFGYGLTMPDAFYDFKRQGA